jgi:hypothetical protein
MRKLGNVAILEGETIGKAGGVYRERIAPSLVGERERWDAYLFGFARR